jgi:Uma2 family endonuclease
MPAQKPAMTYAEYLAFEEQSDEKHEFLDGELFATSGGTPDHGALAVAISAALSGALRGRPCRVHSSDVRVRVQATGLAAYPDVSVVCGKLETDAEAPHAITNPVLLVEVLSDSTEARDRGEKAAHYRHLPSLREYVLVSQRQRRGGVQAERGEALGAVRVRRGRDGGARVGGVLVRGRRGLQGSARRVRHATVAEDHRWEGMNPDRRSTRGRMLRFHGRGPGRDGARGPRHARPPRPLLSACAGASAVTAAVVLAASSPSATFGASAFLFRARGPLGDGRLHGAEADADAVT